ncbi:MAG: pitrilysin family protein [Bacteriovoracaceae bacterium]|nr:pitrilysin family protein [Bacteriovoracaceae bacterium]
MGKFYGLLWLSIALFHFLVGCSHAPEVVATKDAQELGNSAPSASDFPKKTTLIKEVSPDEKIGEISLNLRKYQLSNGLKVILAKNDLNPIFSLYVHYGVGSKHETPGMTGSSHFLEHMMFKGAKKFGAGAFDRLVEGNGGSNNAYTNNDATVYHENMPIEALELMVDVESDRMQNLLLEEQGFMAEKNVVLEEKKMRYENSPHGQLMAGVSRKLLIDTPYETPVIGTDEDIKRVTRDELYQYFKNFYAPNNATIVIAGKLDFDKTIGWIEKSFGNIPPSFKLNFLKEGRENPALYTLKHKGQVQEEFYGLADQPMFLYGFPGMAYGDPSHPAMEMLSLMLGGGASSVLEQKYVKGKNPKLSTVYTGDMSMQHAGIFILGGTLLPGIDRKKFFQELESDLVTFCKKNITQGQIDKFKNLLFRSFFEQLDTNHGLADFLGNEEIYSGNFLNYQNTINNYFNLGPNQVKSACEVAINLNRSYRLVLWSKFKNKMVIK